MDGLHHLIITSQTAFVSVIFWLYFCTAAEKELRCHSSLFMSKAARLHVLIHLNNTWPWTTLCAPSLNNRWQSRAKSTTLIPLTHSLFSLRYFTPSPSIYHCVSCPTLSVSCCLSSSVSMFIKLPCQSPSTSVTSESYFAHFHTLQFKELHWHRKMLKLIKYVNIMNRNFKISK